MFANLLKGAHSVVGASISTAARTAHAIVEFGASYLWTFGDSHMRMRILLVPELHHRSGCKADRIDDHC